MTNEASTTTTPDTSDKSIPTLRQLVCLILPFENIHEEPGFNARKKYEGIPELAETIRREGLLENLVVQMDPKREGHYWLRGGHRRYAALTLLGTKNVACNILPVDTDDIDALFASGIENVERQDLKVWELGDLCLRIKAKGISAAKIGERFGYSRQHVSNCIKAVSAIIPEVMKEIRESVATVPVDLIFRMAYMKPAEQREAWAAFKGGAPEPEDGAGDTSNGPDRTPPDTAGGRVKVFPGNYIKEILGKLRKLQKEGGAEAKGAEEMAAALAWVLHGPAKGPISVIVKRDQKAASGRKGKKRGTRAGKGKKRAKKGAKRAGKKRARKSA